MNKPNLSKIAKSVQSAASKHSPEILTGIGIAGMISAGVLAVRTTPKALFLLNEELENRGLEVIDQHSDVSFRDEFTPLETVKMTWKCYIPAAVTGAISVACLIGASSVNVRRNAALATAYTLSESALKGYQEKVIETIGEKKERDVRDAVAKEKLLRNPVREVILTNKGGHTKCYDAITDRYFESDREIINRAANELNRRMRDEMYVTLNDFYYELGLDSSSMGDMLGWNIDKGYVDIDFSSHLDANGTPCLVMDYQVAPVYDYR